jgi:hypothetical protein
MAEEDNGEYFNPEEEVKINPTQACTLAKVEIKTGEEDEDIIYKARGRIYRFRENEWKERGTGDMKLLRHKTDKRIRFILRQDKTLKIVANFIIQDKPLCDLKPHQGSDKMFYFLANDCSEETPVIEKFVIKLGNAEKAKLFKKNFDDAQVFNKLAKEGKDSELIYAPIFKDVEAENKKTDASKEDKKETEKDKEK